MTTGAYPPGCTQAMHDAAFGRDSTAAEQERAAELAREDFDNSSPDAQAWLADTADTSYLLAVVNAAIAYLGRPDALIYERGGLEDAVGDLRGLYAAENADRWLPQAREELEDWARHE